MSYKTLTMCVSMYICEFAITNSVFLFVSIKIIKAYEIVKTVTFCSNCGDNTASVSGFLIQSW